MTRPHRRPTLSPVTQADFLPLADIAKLQAARWAAQVAYVAHSSPFFGRLWGGKAAPPRLEE
ncbi:MAG TPA: hypothetical protein VI113_12440, partial [Alphaproteobacteria bacterium]